VTYVGRKPMKKAHRGGGSNKNPVFSLVERDGRVHSTHMPDGLTISARCSTITPRPRAIL
jgi:hypothetical protein